MSGRRLVWLGTELLRAAQLTACALFSLVPWQAGRCAGRGREHSTTGHKRLEGPGEHLGLASTATHATRQVIADIWNVGEVDYCGRRQ